MLDTISEFWLTDTHPSDTPYEFIPTSPLRIQKSIRDA